MTCPCVTHGLCNHSRASSKGRRKSWNQLPVRVETRSRSTVRRAVPGQSAAVGVERRHRRADTLQAERAGDLRPGLQQPLRPEALHPASDSSSTQA